MGIAPAVGLLYNRAILVAPGDFPQLRGFPVKWGHVDDETASCTIAGTLTLVGRAHMTLGFLTVDPASEGRPIHVFVAVNTRITGLSRHGLPYIGQGQRVRVEAVHCGREVVARRIIANGPIVPETTAEDLLGPDWRGGPSIATSARRHGWWVVGAVAVAAAVAGGVLIARRRPGTAHPG